MFCFIHCPRNSQSVDQYLTTCTQEEEIPMLMSLLKQHTASNDKFKVMVFFSTARLCECMAAVARTANIENVLGTSLSLLF